MTHNAYTQHFDKDTRKQHSPEYQYRMKYATGKYARVHWIGQAATSHLYIVSFVLLQTEQ